MPLIFPVGFLWGAATSSHQVEGDNTRNDWHDWERAGRIHDGTTSGRAAEWWNGRAEEDLRRAADLGHNAHRLSLEWSRLEPEEGRFDDAAFDRYAQILGAARGLGIRAMVTVNHFTLPRWAAARGGWLHGELPRRFARYAAECTRRLSDRVELWATLNEPAVLAIQAYAGRQWPPGKGSLVAFGRALGNMMRAHGRAHRAMHEAASGVRVGIVVNMPYFEAHRPEASVDQWAAAAQDFAFNESTLRALRRRRRFDWVGLNYYGRYRVKFDPRAAGTAFGRHVQDDNTRTEHTDWGEPHPAGLTSQLLRLAELGVPVYVTENGIYDNVDAVRPRFLVEHVRAVHEALDRGADVRGYFFWSLVDNFEWAEGWSTHFGLLALDRETQERTPRPSAQVYARICRANGVPDELL